MACFVYVLESLRDKRFYVGITKCIEERLLRHNSGRVASTKRRLPFRLMHYEVFVDYTAARRRERYLKSSSGRTTLNSLHASVAKLADAPA